MKAKRIAAISAVLTITCGTSAAVAQGIYLNEQAWNRACDGVDVTSRCTADDGIKYSKYIYHEAEPEKTETITHPAEPAVTHTLHHEAQYGTRKVPNGCIETNISYKRGTCALSRCRDGKYSGSTGWGTCNYHGGVWYGGGPWTVYKEETYLVKAAWDETIVDVPAKDAWEETVVISPATEAYIEKVAA